MSNNNSNTCGSATIVQLHMNQTQRRGFGSVRFVQSDSSVRFGFGCQTLWVRSVRLGMALNRGSSSVCSVRVRFDSHLYAALLQFVDFLPE